MNNHVEIKDVLLADIVVKENIQQRMTINYECIHEYVEALQDGAAFPPVILFDDGKQLLLSDGMHRYKAYQDAQKSTIKAEIHKGTERDAVFYAVGANSNHGLRRTNQDKRKAVLTLLSDADWQKMSDNEIAKTCQVSQPFVSKIRKEMPTYNDYKSTTKRIGADGREIDVSNIGSTKNQQPQPSESAPAADSSPEKPVLETTDQNDAASSPNQVNIEDQQEPAVASMVADGDDRDNDLPATENQTPEPSEAPAQGEQEDQQPEQVLDTVCDTGQATEDIQNAESTDTQDPNDPIETEEVQGPLQADVIEHAGSNKNDESTDAMFEDDNDSENLRDMVLQTKNMDLEKLLQEKDEELEKCQLRISQLEDEVETLRNENAYLKEVAKEPEPVS